jgi:EAL domain-containing protein (putative c-di-GMP-specific phosphodiesterase class I)
VTLDRVVHRRSSQAILQNLPVDYLKIDGRSMKNGLQNPRYRDRLQKINQIGQNLGMKTIAHCVETPELLEATKNIGFHYAQGFGLARPTPFDFAYSMVSA